jgi:hypothetical protein
MKFMNRNSVSLFFLLTVILIVLLSNSYGFRRQREYCSLLSHCQIEVPAETCPVSYRKPVDGIEYKNQRCTEAKLLVKRGVIIDNYQGRKLYGFLGQKYRVDYYVTDKLNVKQAQFEYILNDIPLAAKVVNCFQETKYSVQYLDGEEKRYWAGTNGSNLSGEANLIAGGIKQKDLVYFGFGIAKILLWELKGQILFYFSYTPVENNLIKYDLHVVVSPGGAVVNAIMNMDLFKRVVRNKIKEVFEDITNSAAELNNTSYNKIIKMHPWSESDKEKIEILKSL